VTPTPRPSAPEDLTAALTTLLSRHHNGRLAEIRDLKLLTGGASRQTWSFDAVIEGGETLPLVLRMDPRRGPNYMARETEYALLEAAYAAGVPTPKVLMQGDESIGAPGFIMERVEGETIPRRLLRDDEYANTREVMTAQLGTALAAIHRIGARKEEGGRRKEGAAETALEGLSRPDGGKSPAESELDRYEITYRAMTPEPHPAFELAFRWLRQRLPECPEPTLVHGDYRIGNVIFGQEGLRSVLDWELAHVGDPVEDLGFICVRSWRFGSDHLPCGGIGTREELWDAYEKAGGRKVDRAAARWWEVFGNVKWGIICISQAATALNDVTRKSLSPGRALELAAIGRRTAETEWELIQLIDDSSQLTVGRGPGG
jgi:aminoglycoside phosphotransferase (APT) family kinase protein